MLPARRRKRPPLIQRQASEFALKSRLDRPLQELEPLRLGLLMAEVALLGYLAEDQANLAAGTLGFTDGKFFATPNCQAYWYQGTRDSVVVIRGHELDADEDVAPWIDPAATEVETGGRVNRRFQAQADEIWPALEAALDANDRPIWFVGHSLGAAVATLCARRCVLSGLRMEPEALVTFGSPRVGSLEFAEYVQLPHFRFEHVQDRVVHQPSIWQGYRHGGQQILIGGGQSPQASGRGYEAPLPAAWNEILGRRHAAPGVHAITDYIDVLFAAIREPR